jgi:hypothetical protein
MLVSHLIERMERILVFSSGQEVQGRCHCGVEETRFNNHGVGVRILVIAITWSK